MTIAPWPPPAIFPAGHDLEGQPMERGRFCESCRERFFLQTAVAESYIVELEELGGNWQEAFLALCEITKHFVSFPKVCTSCSRKQLTPEGVNAQRTNLAGRPGERGARSADNDMDDSGFRGRYARLQAARSYLESAKGEAREDWHPGSSQD